MSKGILKVTKKLRKQLRKDCKETEMPVFTSLIVLSLLDKIDELENEISILEHEINSLEPGMGWWKL